MHVRMVYVWGVACATLDEFAGDEFFAGGYELTSFRGWFQDRVGSALQFEQFVTVWS